MSGAAAPPAARGDFAFLHHLPARGPGAATVLPQDAALACLDRALAASWRRLALPRSGTAAALGGDLSLSRAELTFHAPLCRDDGLDVALRCMDAGRGAIVMDGAIFRADSLRVRARLEQVFIDARSGQVGAVPPVLCSLFRALDAGEPVLRMQMGSWAELGPRAAAVREAVFIAEQGIRREDEWDAADATALHVVALNGLGQPVATARLLLHGATAGVAHVGRVAVLRELRGAGHGRAMMRALETAAAERGVRMLRLNAQLSAAAFYERLGFVARGPAFEEVGIPHVAMCKRTGG